MAKESSLLHLTHNLAHAMRADPVPSHATPSAFAGRYKTTSDERGCRVNQNSKLRMSLRERLSKFGKGG